MEYYLSSPLRDDSNMMSSLFIKIGNNEGGNNERNSFILIDLLFCNTIHFPDGATHNKNLLATHITYPIVTQDV